MEKGYNSWPEQPVPLARYLLSLGCDCTLYSWYYCTSWNSWDATLALSDSRIVFLLHTFSKIMMNCLLLCPASFEWAHNVENWYNWTSCVTCIILVDYPICKIYNSIFSYSEQLVERKCFHCLLSDELTMVISSKTFWKLLTRKLWLLWLTDIVFHRKYQLKQWANLCPSITS